jgi:hypothetical protein
MDTFDLKKYLIENKLTSNSNLNELAKHGSWTPEKLEQEAAKYKKAGDFFKGNQYAYIEYRKAVKNGIIQNKFKQKNPTPGPSSPTMNVSDTPQFGEPTTTAAQPKPKSNTPSEPYTYDESSLLDFVKKHIGDIEEDVTGHYDGGYSRH